MFYALGVATGVLVGVTGGLWIAGKYVMYTLGYRKVRK